MDIVRRKLILVTTGTLRVKQQYISTNSPNWSPYISLKKVSREFDKRSLGIFCLVIIFSHNLTS